MNHTEAAQTTLCVAGAPPKPLARRGLCSFVLAATLQLFAVAAASAQTINATVTADNA